MGTKLGRNVTVYVIFISFINSTWLLGPIMHSDRLRIFFLIFFSDITSGMDLLLGRNIPYTVLKSKMATTTGQSFNIGPYWKINTISQKLEILWNPNWMNNHWMVPYNFFCLKSEMEDGLCHRTNLIYNPISQIVLKIYSKT